MSSIKNMSNPTKRPNGCASLSAFVAFDPLSFQQYNLLKEEVSTSTNTALWGEHELTAIKLI